MKSQPAAARVGTSAQRARTAGILASQAPIVAELRAVHAAGDELVALPYRYTIK